MANPLTRTQRDTLRRRLEDERARILRVLQALGTAGPEPDREIETEEAAQRETERTHDLEVEGRERALLAEVDHALARMGEGSYGLSEETGEPIPFPRLLAVPWARRGSDE